jgi:hypothetical protein
VSVLELPTDGQKMLEYKRNRNLRSYSFSKYLGDGLKKEEEVPPIVHVFYAYVESPTNAIIKEFIFSLTTKTTTILYMEKDLCVVKPSKSVSHS